MASGLAVREFDAIVVGTGFAASFFLERWLERAAADAKVLVLEKGERRSHGWQLAQGEARLRREGRATFDNKTPDKPWTINVAFGGGSNCWWASTPRLLPNDFETGTRYGAGTDWPVSYEDLEPHYARVEARMGVAGPAETPYPKSTAYPLPEHAVHEPDRLLRAAYPDAYFPAPCARPSRAFESRPRCCANGVCGLCPIDSKWSVQNSMAGLFADPRVELETGASVQAVDIEAGIARGVVWQRVEPPGRVERARASLVVLAANAIFNPHILQRSGLEHPELGRNLFEQAGVMVFAHLDGVDSFQGTTSLTAHGYMLYDGEHRRERSAVLIESSNVPTLRPERGKWRQLYKLRCVLEDLPRRENRVRVSSTDPSRPEVVFAGRSEHVARARARLESDLERVLAPLPVERLIIEREYEPTESHVLGTVRMGGDPDSSVVDGGLVHHRVRNLLVLGGSAFPTGSPANPTLTIAALASRAADQLLR
jgi:choline dehydrogenase-like flavoprotein